MDNTQQQEECVNQSSWCDTGRVPIYSQLLRRQDVWPMHPGVIEIKNFSLLPTVVVEGGLNHASDVIEWVPVKSHVYSWKDVWTILPGLTEKMFESNHRCASRKICTMQTAGRPGYSQLHRNVHTHRFIKAWVMRTKVKCVGDPTQILQDQHSRVVYRFNTNPAIYLLVDTYSFIENWGHIETVNI